MGQTRCKYGRRVYPLAVILPTSFPRCLWPSRTPKTGFTSWKHAIPDRCACCNAFLGHELAMCTPREGSQIAQQMYTRLVMTFQLLLEPSKLRLSANIHWIKLRCAD